MAQKWQNIGVPAGSKVFNKYGGLVCVENLLLIN